MYKDGIDGKTVINGKDGKDGKDFGDCKDGKDCTVCKECKDGKDGKSGLLNPTTLVEVKKENSLWRIRSAHGNP